MRCWTTSDANADYQFAVGDTDSGQRDGIRGAAGVRYTWRNVPPKGPTRRGAGWRGELLEAFVGHPVEKERPQCATGAEGRRFDVPWRGPDTEAAKLKNESRVSFPTYSVLRYRS